LLLVVLLTTLLGVESDNNFVDSNPDAADRIRKLFAAPNSFICHGTAIHSLLTKDRTVDGVRNTPWPKIMAIADDFIKEQEREVALLNQQVAHFKEDIADKQTKEAKKSATTAQIVELITASMTDEGSFGSIANAKASECGAASPSVRRKLTPKVTARAFKKCSAIFAEKAKAFFEGGVRAPSMDFRKECDKLLPGDLAGESASYCDELCQSFADVVKQCSYGALVGPASVELEDKLQDVLLKLQSTELELNKCKDAKVLLGDFRLQTEAMNVKVKVEFGKVQDARDALAEAEDVVLDIEDDLDAKSESTKEAIGLLTGTSKKVTVAKEAFNDLQAAEFLLKLQIGVGRRKLKESKQQLDMAEAADTAVQQVKALVAQTMFNMNLLFDEAVREPVRNLGFDARMNIVDEFQATPQSTKAGQEFGIAIKALDTYCEKEAKPAFAALDLQELDLNPLCNFGDVDDAVKGVKDAVGHTMNSAVEDLKSVQQWLDPYFPQKDMTKDLAEQFIKEGEPAHLREIVGVYHLASYYKGYLRRWQRGKKDSFLELYKKLRAAIKTLDEDYKQFTEDISKLLVKVEEVRQKQDDAKKKLDDAIKSNDIAVANKVQAETLLRKAQEEAKKAQDNVDKLRKQVEEATKRYNDAKAALKEAHDRGTGMLQLMDEIAEAGEEHLAAAVGKLQPVKRAA